MIKRDELGNADSTLNKAGLVEPIFVLRATDILAPIVVRYWLQIAEDAGVPPSKIAEAWAVVNAMKEWPDRKLPD